MPPRVAQSVMNALVDGAAARTRQRLGVAAQLEFDAPTCCVELNLLCLPLWHQTLRAGDRRVHFHTHAVATSARQPRPVDKWAIRVRGRSVCPQSFATS